MSRDRFTEKDENGEWMIRYNENWSMFITRKETQNSDGSKTSTPVCVYSQFIDRLAQYEDIGLSPDEIESQLATYSAVLCDMTNNRMSKTNYTLEAIRSVISDAQAENCDRCDNTEQLKRYEEAEADGRLIILPVKEGTPLFVDGKIFAPHCKGQVHEVTGWYYSYPMIYKDFRGEHDYVIDPDGIGTSTFLTREEAEATLKERYGKHE